MRRIAMPDRPFEIEADFEPAGDLSFAADVKEGLLAELHEQTDHVDVRERDAGASSHRGGCAGRRSVLRAGGFAAY